MATNLGKEPKAKAEAKEGSKGEEPAAAQQPVDKVAAVPLRTAASTSTGNFRVDYASVNADMEKVAKAFKELTALDLTGKFRALSRDDISKIDKAEMNRAGIKLIFAMDDASYGKACEMIEAAATPEKRQLYARTALIKYTRAITSTLIGLAVAMPTADDGKRNPYHLMGQEMVKSFLERASTKEEQMAGIAIAGALNTIYMGALVDLLTTKVLCGNDPIAGPFTDGELLKPTGLRAPEAKEGTTREQGAEMLHEAEAAVAQAIFDMHTAELGALNVEVKTSEIRTHAMIWEKIAGRYLMSQRDMAELLVGAVSNIVVDEVETRQLKPDDKAHARMVHAIEGGLFGVESALLAGAVISFGRDATALKDPMTLLNQYSEAKPKKEVVPGYG